MNRINSGISTARKNGDVCIKISGKTYGYVRGCWYFSGTPSDRTCVGWKLESESKALGFGLAMVNDLASIKSRIAKRCRKTF